MAVLSATLESMHKMSAFGEGKYSASECFAEYRRLVLAHTFAAAAEAPSVNIGVFALPDVRELTDFVQRSLFQQFLLYRSVLVCPMESITKRAEVTLDLPRAPPNLMRGKPREEVKAL